VTWTVPANTYPDGNGVAGMGTMLTILQYETKQTVYKLHPEFWRRYKALMIFALTQGVHLGVGTGWRIQPNPPPPGFAPPGNSNHEGFPADGKSGGAVAIDTVCDVSWPWMEKNLAAYGLRSFVQPSTTGYKGSNEPWHIQPAEIPAARSWRTQPWKLEEFALPGETPPPPLPMPSPMPATPKGTHPMHYLVMKYGGTPESGWSGYYSDGNKRYPINAASGGLSHCARLVKAGAKDAKTGGEVTSTTWVGVSHTTSATELTKWLGPA
jgi:hypothetical protein